MTSIRLITSIPGPKSREWSARRQAAVARGPASVLPVFIARAEGAVVEDVDGNRLLDFAGGIGCMNAGHCAPEVVEAASRQLRRFWHTCFSVAPYEGYVRLAEILNAKAPGDFPKKTFLVNSGAEAVENAVKIARAYTGRPAIVCFEDAFHGRTLLALSLTSKIQPYKAGFGPFAPEIYRLPYAYCFRCSYNLKYPECKVECAHRLEDFFRKYVEAKSVAAVIVEPVLGEGGFVVPPPEFLPILCEICRRHGVLVIADEVQTGIGRTGATFACERYGIVPDLLLTAKSLSGGLPLGAVTGRAEIMDAPVEGGLGGTFSGNPVACEAALAVWKILESQNLPERAQRIGDIFRRVTQNWRERFRMVGDVRGLGAMCAIELVKDPVTREPAKEETQQVLRRCHERGLLIISAGTYGNAIRMLVPLVATEEQVAEGLQILEQSLAALHGAA